MDAKIPCPKPRKPSRKWADGVQLYPPRFRRGRIPHCGLRGSAGLSSRRARKRLAGTYPFVPSRNGLWECRPTVRALSISPGRGCNVSPAASWAAASAHSAGLRVYWPRFGPSALLRDDDERIWTAKSGTCGRLAAEELLRAFARRDRLRQGACVRVHTNCIVDFPCRGLEFRVPHDVNRRSVKLPRPERTGRCDETPRVKSAVNRSATGCRAVPSRKWTDRNVPHVATSAGAYRRRRNEIDIGGRGDRRVACLGGSRDSGEREMRLATSVQVAQG